MFIIIIIIIFTLRNKALVGYMIKAYKTYIYVLVFLLQGYFGAVGALMELLKTTEDP